MAETKTVIEIETTADTSGADKVVEAIDEVSGKASEAGDALQNEVGGKKGLLDEVGAGLADSLSESLGLSGELARSFEQVVGPALATLGPLAVAVAVGLAAKSAIDKKTDALNNESAAADRAGFAQKRLSDETISGIRSAKNAAELTRDRERLEKQLSDAQQARTEAETTGLRKGNEEEQKAADLQIESLKRSIALVASAEKGKTAEDAVAASQKQFEKDGKAFDEAKAKRGKENADEEIKKLGEIAKAAKIAQDAEEERLKPTQKILGLLGQEIENRAKLAAETKAAPIVTKAADQITDLQRRRDSELNSAQNSNYPEIRAESAAIAAKLQSRIDAVKTEAQAELQKIADQAQKIIADSAAPNAKVLTDTTQVATDAQTPIAEGALTLKTAVEAIPQQLQPVSDAVASLSPALTAGFNAVAAQIAAVAASIPGIVAAAVAASARNARAPGK